MSVGLLTIAPVFTDAGVIEDSSRIVFKEFPESLGVVDIEPAHHCPILPDMLLNPPDGVDCFHIFTHRCSSSVADPSSRAFVFCSFALSLNLNALGDDGDVLTAAQY